MEQLQGDHGKERVSRRDRGQIQGPPGLPMHYGTQGFEGGGGGSLNWNPRYAVSYKPLGQPLQVFPANERRQVLSFLIGRTTTRRLQYFPSAFSLEGLRLSSAPLRATPKTPRCHISMVTPGGFRGAFIRRPGPREAATLSLCRNCRRDI